MYRKPEVSLGYMGPCQKEKRKAHTQDRHIRGQHWGGERENTLLGYEVSLGSDRNVWSWIRGADCTTP